MKGYTNLKSYRNRIPKIPKLEKAGVLEIHMNAPHAPYGMGKLHEVSNLMNKKIIGIKNGE